MTAQERAQLVKLEEKVDRLPDEIIARLDDRYIKKDEIDKRFVTRAELAFLKWTFGIILTVLSIVAIVKDYIKN